MDKGKFSRHCLMDTKDKGAGQTVWQFLMPPFVALKMEVTATGFPTGFSENKSSFQRRRISAAKVNQHLLKRNKSFSACLRDPLKSGSKSLRDHEDNNEELLLPATESQTCLHSIHTQLKHTTTTTGKLGSRITL